MARWRDAVGPPLLVLHRRRQAAARPICYNQACDDAGRVARGGSSSGAVKCWVTPNMLCPRLQAQGQGDETTTPYCLFHRVTAHVVHVLTCVRGPSGPAHPSSFTCVRSIYATPTATQLGADSHYAHAAHFRPNSRVRSVRQIATRQSPPGDPDSLSKLYCTDYCTHTVL